MKLDRRLIENLDWVVPMCVIMLSVIGIMTIYSATRPLGGGPQQTYYIRQAYWLAIGLAAMAGAASINYEELRRFAPAIFVAGVVGLIAVLIAGRLGMGAKRWINIGPLSLQPSEFFKLALIIALSNYFSRVPGAMRMREMVVAFAGFVLLPFLLIVKQPDLGTALIVIFLFVTMSMVKGVGKKVVTMAVVIALISVPFVGSIMWDGLKDYQKKRILAFVDPSHDPEGTSYHITQSKVAVGSGGFTGKGYLEGTQGPFRFLPEKHTDFVFAAFAEEWGFIGSVFLLAIYLVLIMRGISTAEKAKDEFGRMLALGITFMFTGYMFINIGMTMGLVPVVGIPLPFMSYGGTALVSNCFAAGILISIRARRFELFY